MPNLDLGEEELGQRGIDQVIGGGVQRHGEKIENLGGEAEADAETDREADQRIDQPAAQLQQMLHQRRLGRFQRGLVFRGRINHGAVFSAGVAAAGAAVTSNSPLRGST